jgi:PAS domain S-box-containing protein
VRAVWNRSLETGEPYKIEYRIRLPDGTYHWLLVRALPERAANGSIVRWVGVIIDIEDRYASEEARETYAALVENSSDFIAILDPRGNVVYVNRAGRDLLGIGSLDEARTTPWPEYFAESDRRFVIEEIGPSVERAGSWSGDFHLRHFRSEKAVPIALNVFALRSRDGAPLGIATVSRDLGERKRVEDGLRLLSRTGAAVVDSLDYARTLRNIARAFVDGFAAYCLIDVIRPDGTWERTVEHRDPSLVKLFLDLEQPRGNHPIARTIESGISSITPIDDDWALNLDSVTDRLAAIRRLRVRSIITVPIKLPSGELVGAITCALDDATIRDNFGADDLAFVEEVGRRAGSAIANVRLYERERRVALELQAASLPATLPAIEGVLLDAAYRPGSDEAKIGGDWYDAFELADKRLVFTVGDVLGHGLQAAVTMAKLRLAMQSAAIIDADPNVMLSVADAILRVSDPDAYATAIAAVYDREQRMVTFAGAGHPAPALRTPDGRLDFMSNMGVMLGLGGQRDRQTLSVAVPSGSVLIFYTDGLVEVTRDIDEGYGRMSRALASDQIQTAERPAELLVDAVLMNDSARDDIAVLVVRFL